MSNDDAKAHKISRMIGVAGVLFLSCACSYFLSMKISADKEVERLKTIVGDISATNEELQIKVWEMRDQKREVEAHCARKESACKWIIENADLPSYINLDACFNKLVE